MRWLDGWMFGITDLMDMNLGKLPEIVRNREAWHAVAHDLIFVLLNNSLIHSPR